MTTFTSIGGLQASPTGPGWLALVVLLRHL